MHFAPAFVTLSTLVTYAAAAASGVGPKITVPSKDNWWVAKSSNVLTWDCNNSQRNNFTVIITNPNPATKLNNGGLAFIATQENSQCTKEITQLQSSQEAATGYKILFANPLNNSDVYSESEEFEIKPLGSAYPSSSSAGSTPTGSTSGQAAQSTGGGNGAASYKASLGYGFAAVGALVGLLAA
ncbi:hypothetical protein AAF712_011374 [Marasmius tenuissimus]|uniref:Uncharacterized protein n=1 Tax=Marasmius tenuissimus TaxID=585030 RepID=A0ABR2ZLA9_9AGAR|nr:hypothetical protein PM082_011635 [Marasmius tenuissimus]